LVERLSVTSTPPLPVLLVEGTSLFPASRVVVRWELALGFIGMLVQAPSPNKATSKLLYIALRA
jgi:hypothetical protein